MKRTIANGFLGVVLTALIFFVNAVPSFGEEAKLALDAQENAAVLAEAQKAENAQDWESALQKFEALYETGNIDQAGLIELRKKFETLRPIVKKNTVPENANVWRVKAYIVKTLDFTWDDKGSKRRCAATYTQEEIDRIVRGMKGFEDFVWEFTDGWLRIDWDCEVVDGTLNELSPIGDRFWIGPREALKILPEVKENEADTIMVFAKTHDHEAKENNDFIPLFSFGAAIGRWDPVTKGATYISFAWEKNSAIDEPDGEPMMHEWLHSLQWSLDEARKWPRGLTGDPDGGRFVGEERALEDADPCYRRDPAKEKSWIELYRHILQTHYTRNMLRDASTEYK